VVEDSDLELVGDDDGLDGMFGEKTTVSEPMFGDPMHAAVVAANKAAAQPSPLAEQKTAILDGAVHPVIVPPPKTSGVVSVQPQPGDMKSESTVILQDGSGSGPKGPFSSSVVVAKAQPETPTLMAGVIAPVIPPHAQPQQQSSVPSHITPHGTGQVHAPLPYAPARSTLWKDVLIGVAVAVALVGGALGVRATMRGKAPDKATLVVMASRSGDVTIDGAPHGKVEEGKPLTLKDLAAGSHLVLVKAADGAEFKQTVQLAAGDVSVLQASMQAAAAVGSGTLRLNLLTAGAQVWVDGAQLPDDAWKQPISLRADVAHEIRVTKPQREEVKLSVTLKAGEEMKKDVELLPGYGKLQVSSDPPGAEVNVNGRRAGVTPLSVNDLDPGKSARVTIRLKGFVGVVKHVTFDKQLDQVVDAKLVPGDDKMEKPEKPDKPVLADVSVPDKPERPEKPAKPEKQDKPEKEDLAPVKATPGSGEPGYLVANTQPWAKVLIDGKDTGKTTPIAPRSKIALKPGKHVVTFVANGKKFNFDIQVKAGEDVRLIKQLADGGP
jgi:hypothetical protein